MESSIMLCEATVSQLEAQQQRLRQNSCSPPNTAPTNNSILQQQQHLHMQLSDTTTRSTGSSNSSININNTEMSQINTNMAGNSSSNSISGGVGMGVLLNAAATGLSYGGSGPSSLVNSPALGRRKRYTSNSSNCSSQFNNNYAGLDVESLEDMLRKRIQALKNRSADFKLSTQHSFTATSATITAVTLGYCGVAFKRKCNFFQDKLPGS
uniref:Uncharacterized protein n=1 Tax=Glossina palpalis gambiensis TaxID=67801 RepID=A0A1B0BWU6_9MUSC